MKPIIWVTAKSSVLPKLKPSTTFLKLVLEDQGGQVINDVVYKVYTVEGFRRNDTALDLCDAISELPEVVECEVNWR